MQGTRARPSGQEVPAGNASGCSSQKTPNPTRSSECCPDHGELLWLQRSCWEHWVSTAHPTSSPQVSLGSLQPSQ